MTRSLKLDFATAPAELVAAVRATAEERGITTSRAIQDALTAYLGRPVGPTADDVVRELERAGVASPAVERAVRGVWERGTTKRKAGDREVTKIEGSRVYVDGVYAGELAGIEPAGVVYTNEPPIGEPEAVRRKVYVRKGARSR